MPRRGENIRKRKDGRWEGRYRTYEAQSGRYIVRSVYAKTYYETKEKLLSAKTSKKETSPVECVRFQTAAEEWLAVVKKTKKHATYIKYRSVYENHIKMKLQNLSCAELNETILVKTVQSDNNTSLSESLRKSISCVMNQIISYVSIHYPIHLSHYSFPIEKQIKKPVNVLNQTEQTKLLQCLYREMDIYKMGIVLCISTGLRLGEICSLKWEDVDLKQKVLHVNTTVQRIAVDGQKTKTVLMEGAPKSIFSKREIPLSDELTHLLDVYHRQNAKYVINNNKPMEPRTYQYKFQKYLKNAGVEKKNFHILRHTFATNCIDSGADVKSLSEILGHSDVKITLNRYVHPTTETKRHHMNALSAVYGQYLGQI